MKIITILRYIFWTFLAIVLVGQVLLMVSFYRSDSFGITKFISREVFVYVQLAMTVILVLLTIGLARLRGDLNKIGRRLKGALFNIINGLQSWWIRRQIVPRPGTRRRRLEEEAVTNYHESLTKRSGASEWSPDHQWRERRNTLKAYCTTHAQRLNKRRVSEGGLLRAIKKLTRLEPDMPVTSEHLAALDNIIANYYHGLSAEEFSSWFPDLGLATKEGERLSAEECVWFQQALMAAKYDWAYLISGV